MKKSIIIDVDDVICESVFYEVLRKIVGSNKKLEDCTEYHAEDNLDVTPKQMEEYYTSVTSKTPYKNAILTPNCYEVIKKLNEKYDVYICSACVIEVSPNKSGNLFKFKYDFLIKTFPFLDPFKFIFTSAKKMLSGDILIDDKPSNFVGRGIKKKFLFTAYHNKNLTDKELKNNA